jgi:hypothetical protein
VQTIDLTEKKKNNIVLMSVLYPGLGQYSAGDKNKAYFFSITTALCIVGSIYSYSEANRIYTDYSNLQYKNNNLYNEYNNEMDQMYCFMGLGLATWILNIYDAYKISNKSDYKEPNLKMSFLNNKIYISYSKRY